VYACKYPNPEPILELMVALVRRMKNRKNIVETTQFQEAIDFYDSIYKIGYFGVFLMPSGLGKSFASQYYAVTKENVVYCVWRPSMNLKEMLYSVADAVVSSPSKGSLDDVAMEIIKNLRAKPRMIIIDEADLMPEKMANIIRSIHDDGNCSISLTGMPILERTLRGGSKNTAYVYSRINRWRTASESKPKDVLSWADHYGYRISDELVDDLLRWIKKAGEYRMLKNLFDTVLPIQQEYDTHDEAVREAYKQVLSRGQVTNKFAA